ncbi:MAG TPA: hypothetical protein VNX21_02640 [Candidatus Thermoplasmatota archaeon]|nr:hypothetical protein [Candidatus Thermoplasmatota archaeon]
MTRTPTAPLGRSVARDVLDWEDVEPRGGPPQKDVLGLTLQDRAALGLTPAARTAEAPTLPGDAHAALADLIARGAAVGKAEKRRR